MAEWKQKRFWKAAEVVPAEGGYGIALDGRPVKTPAKAALLMPTRAMAEAAAAEWDAQQDVVRPVTMPVTRAANAAIDKVVPFFDEVASEIAGYGESDLLCYRAESPEALFERQSAAWDPLLDWAEEALGARLATATGVMHVPQDPRALQRLEGQVRAMDPFRLTALSDLVGLSGSLVLGFAVTQGARSPQDAWAVSRIDETWQAEQWGEDEEAAAAEEAKRRAFMDAARFHVLAAR